jgi:restriction system protein
MSNLDYKFDQMMNPLLKALKELGGSGTNEEINLKVAQSLKIPQNQLEILHSPGKGTMTELEYRLMWTRTYLKSYGLIENSERGVWSLTSEGIKSGIVNEKEVVRWVREKIKKEKTTIDELPNGPETVKQLTWQEKLLEVVSAMTPAAFEKLAQRILRESGFIQVDVTGRSGDGGIDGFGILRLNGLLSFRVIFQCKKWKNPVRANTVRDFRGAMIGRADKGLIITTSHFTQDARTEANRDGATAIDLIDGDDLAMMLKNLKLGIKTEIIPVENVIIDPSWFSRFEE